MSFNKIATSLISLIVLVLGLVVGLILVNREQDIREKAAELPGTESIIVCVVLVDQTGTISDGSSVPGLSFGVGGFSPSNATEDPPTLAFPQQNFTTPLSLNSDTLNQDGRNDAACSTISNLSSGSYY